MQKRIFFFLIILFAAYNSNAQQVFDAIGTIDSTKLHITNYTAHKGETVDISDFVLIKNIRSREGVNQLYPAPFDPRAFLLKKGYAKLKDTSKAEKNEVGLQNSAKKAQLGLWDTVVTKKEPVDTIRRDTSQQVTNKSSKNDDGIFPKLRKTWSNVTQFLSDNISWIFGFIGAGTLIQYVIIPLYKNFYIERKFKLLILGRSSAGKTALKAVFIDPGISEGDILKFKPSSESSKHKRRDVIPFGKFEIYPVVTDIPGNQGSIAVDHLMGSKNHAVIFAMATCEHLGDKEKAFVDDDYIRDQFGYLEGRINEIGSRVMKAKPKIVILFINKFDIFSTLSPNDSTSRKQVDEIKRQFARHINLIETEMRKKNIPFEIFIGSTVKKWNTSEALKEVMNQIYKK